MTIEKVELHAMGFRAIVDMGSEILGEPRLDEILGLLGASRKQFSDATAWFSLEFAEALLTQLTEQTGKPDFVEVAAERMLSPRYLGPIYPLYRALGSPLFTYTRLVPLIGRTNKTGYFVVERLADRLIRFTWTNHDSTRERATHMCRLRLRQLQLAPTMFRLPEATVQQPKCLLRGDDACVYEVTWQEAPDRLRSNIGLIGGIVTATVGTWATALPAGNAVVVGALAGLGGWAMGRVLELRHALGERKNELAEHERALTQSAQANEQRYAELLEAKSAVEQKVEERTTELRSATQRLSETLNEIQALDRAKTDFFNNVSHELRSPLTLILAPLEEIVAGRTPPGGERVAFEAMHRNASRLLRLINQLLDLAKIDAGEMKIAPVPVDLPQLIRSCLVGFEAAADRKGVQLEVRAPDSMRDVVLDASWIESAVTNLVANALRLTKRGGAVRVTIEDRGMDVAVAVSDDGPGIAPQDQKNLFERFAQGDSTKRVIGGTGIGLALVREAARLHGGDVKLVSALGSGATFTMTLPRRLDARIDVRPLLVPTPSERPVRVIVDEFIEEVETSERAGPTPNAALALVVEDNPELREFITNVLAVRYRVRAASDGAKGLALALELKPDVVVSDVAMPEMDGYQLCRALRASPDTRATPILLVTARTEVASVLEGFEAGASDYILKPFHGRELLARVDVHVRLRRVMQEFALRERHASLGVLASSVAHQVRNPLTTLVSGLPAMRKRLGNVNESTQQLIEVMIDCAGRIERLTVDLMDLSRVDREAGGPYRPSDGLHSAIRLVRARLPQTVAVEEHIEDAPEIEGRPGDMNHVFLNLLDNAARAVGEVGTIRVEGSTVDGAYVIRVGDSGAGVDAAIAEQIFEPFFTTRQAGEGSGLGLAVAQQVLLRCGGHIDLGRSELGGAMFSVHIPVAQGTSPRPAAHPTLH